MIEENAVNLNNKQALKFSQKRWVTILLGSVFIALVIFLLVYKLNSYPGVWWDEGWTLDAARNWIEHGYLGHYLDGQHIEVRSPVRFPIVIPVALSMKLLGVGIWQGRLPGIIFTIFLLGLFLHLSSRIYNSKVGIAALFIVLCLTAMFFQPIILGRQVLAEIPMMFYLFGGYTLVWLALTRSPAWGVGAALFFGIATHAKLQVPPFWLVSMLLAIWMAVTHKQRKGTRILIGIAIGSIIAAGMFLLIQNFFMPGSLNDPAMITILLNSVIFVFSWPARKTAFTIGALYALPQIAAMIWVGYHLIRSLLASPKNSSPILHGVEADKEILRMALWGLGASWFLWYLTMALFWPRYMFPPYFISCIFWAAWLDKLTNGFDIRALVRRTSAILLRREFNWSNFQAIIIMLAFSFTLGVAVTSAYYRLTAQAPNPILVANYLKNNIPAGARVESFESELLFLAPEINFHYPSDLVSMQLVRKYSIDPQLKIDYDPLEAEPDYLVNGPYASTWYLYNDVIAQGKFQLEAVMGGYQIYHIKNSQSGY